MRIPARIKQQLGRLFAGKKRVKGGVDAGRDSFARLNKHEGIKKRNLLRKINNYRARKATSNRQAFQPPVKTSPWRRRLLLVVCLVLAVGLFIKSSGGETVKTFLAGLDYFSVTSVEVNGCRQASAEQVRGSSGVVINSSLLFIDGDSVSATIKSQTPWVKNVDVVRKWPDTVIIRVQEYEPEAMIAMAPDGISQLFYMDRDGEPFIRVEPGMDFDFPVITGLDLITDQDEKKQRFEEVLYFLRLISANNPNLPAQSISEIHVDPAEGLVIYMVEYPFPIFFGNGEVGKKICQAQKGA